MRTASSLLTLPHSPTTTGKIERFHRTLRIEFDTRQVFRTLSVAQQALDEWVTYYNTERAHQALNDATPASRFQVAALRARPLAAPVERNGEQWVSRTVAANGLVCVDWQQISVGKHFGGSACDVLVGESTLQFWVGSELLKTVARRRAGPVRKKHAEGHAPRR